MSADSAHSRLDNMWNNIENTDNIILIRVINTFLGAGDDDPRFIYDSIMGFTESFEILLDKSNINRHDVELVIEKIKCIELDPSFDNFKKLVKGVYKQNMEEYKYLYLLCYCRARFELYYSGEVCSTMSEYAIKQIYGVGKWNLFLETFNNDL